MSSADLVGQELLAWLERAAKINQEYCDGPCKSYPPVRQVQARKRWDVAQARVKWVKARLSPVDVEPTRT